MGLFLILCSTNDYLAPFDVIKKFAVMIRESGCRVDLVVWDTSDHVGLFRNCPRKYYDTVTTFLDQQVLHHSRTDLWSENERILQTKYSATENKFQKRRSCGEFVRIRAVDASLLWHTMENTDAAQELPGNSTVQSSDERPQRGLITECLTGMHTEIRGLEQVLSKVQQGGSMVYI